MERGQHLDIDQAEFGRALDYLLPTILLLMLRVRFLRDALERERKLDWASALVLVGLLVSKSPEPVGAITQRTALNASTASITVRRLEEAGLIAYGDQPDDRRVVQVTLTVPGTNAAEQALECLTQEFRSQFSLDTGLVPEAGFGKSAYGLHGYAILQGAPSADCLDSVFWWLNHFQASHTMLQRHIGSVKDLTELSFLMLIVLYRTEGATPTDLARTLAVERSTVSRGLRFLLANEYATRMRDPRDRRTVVVTVAPQGRALLERIIPPHVQRDRRDIAS